MQPKWRQSTSDNSMPNPISTAKSKESVVALKKLGPSGLVTMLIGLKWWASASDQQIWAAAVEDVRCCLASIGGGGGKRKSPTSGESGRKGKKAKTIEG